MSRAGNYLREHHGHGDIPLPRHPRPEARRFDGVLHRVYMEDVTGTGSGEITRAPR